MPYGYEEVSMKVALPMGRPFKVRSIASDIEHLGNRVAEGDMHPSMFWPQLARLKSLSEKRAAKRYCDIVDKIEKQEYQDGWVSRWLRQQEYLSEGK